MIKVDDFLAKVNEIEAEGQVYREGGKGADGTCDCIGLIMGALERCGAEIWPMHSSNYAARCKAMLEPIGQLEKGMAVFKCQVGSTLNERYLPGGRYYTCDLNDYYHVGVVMETEPLIIKHCTTGGGANGIVTDTKLGEWKVAGRLLDVDYSSADEGASEPMSAVVTAASGETVNLREKDSKKAALVCRVPIGETVRVLKDMGQWCRVRTADGKEGYMISNYLEYQMPGDTDADDRRTELLDAAERLRKALEDFMGALGGMNG